jgi:hypothetical protein
MRMFVIFNFVHLQSFTIIVGTKSSKSWLSSLNQRTCFSGAIVASVNRPTVISSPGVLNFEIRNIRNIIKKYD